MISMLQLIWGKSFAPASCSGSSQSLSGATLAFSKWYRSCRLLYSISAFRSLQCEQILLSRVTPSYCFKSTWFTHVHSNQSSHSLFRNVFLLWFRFVPEGTKTNLPNVSGVDAIQNLQGVSENLKISCRNYCHNISPHLCYTSAALVFLAARQSNHLGCSLLSQRICRHCAPSCKIDGPARMEECCHMSTLSFSCASYSRIDNIINNLIIICPLFFLVILYVSWSLSTAGISRLIIRISHCERMAMDVNGRLHRALWAQDSLVPGTARKSGLLQILPDIWVLGPGCSITIGLIEINFPMTDAWHV